MTDCPVCGGDGGFLGVMGTKANFRCRACGWTYQTDADDTMLYMDEAAEDGEDEDE